MLTVPEAARRARRNPETVRRWIREGKLRATRVGTQHILDERDLAEFLGDSPRRICCRRSGGTPSGAVRCRTSVEIIRRQRSEH